jgi:hypothetical protein
MSIIIYKKVCTKCSLEKNINEFYKDSSKYDGYACACKECCIKHRNKYRKENKSKIKEYYQNYYKSNNYSKEYYRLNKDKIKQYYKHKYHNNINKRLHHIISVTLNNMINKKYDTSKYLKLFGYTIEELKTHLEKKFKENMSWDNYGEWHIDHIKPKSWFSVDSEQELKKCWSLDNLQPLWADENWSKGNRYKG